MPKKLMEINQILDHGILEDHKKGGLHPKFLVDICFEIKLFCNLYHLLQLAKRGKFTIIFTVPYPIIYITLASMSWSIIRQNFPILVVRSFWSKNDHCGVVLRVLWWNYLNWPCYNYDACRRRKLVWSGLMPNEFEAF